MSRFRNAQRSLFLVLFLLLDGDRAMARSDILDAFVSDLSDTAVFTVLRDGAMVDLPEEIGDRLALPLHAMDIVTVRQGWIEITARYSGGIDRVEASGTGPLVAVTVQADKVPSPFAKVREALSAMVGLLSPSEPEPERVALVTKGDGALPRDHFFPPPHAVATPEESFVLVWNTELANPSVTLSWSNGQELKTPIFSTADKIFELPPSFGAMLGDTALPAEIDWTLLDTGTGLAPVTGRITVVHVFDDPPDDPVLALAWALGRKQVFAARMSALAIQEESGGAGWARLRDRVGLFDR